MSFYKHSYRDDIVLTYQRLQCLVGETVALEIDVKVVCNLWFSASTQRGGRRGQEGGKRARSVPRPAPGILLLHIVTFF